jgi:hypothetical protein
MPSRKARLGLIGAVSACFLIAGCSSLQVPVNGPRIDARDAFSGSVGSITVQAKPIEGRDEYWALFDDNLPESGLAAVWVVVRNAEASEIDLSKTHWKMRTPGGTAAALKTDAVFKRYYRSRRIRLYSVEVDRQARLKMEQLMLQRGFVRPAATAEGYLFFPVAPGSGVWPENGTLVADNIRLQDARQVQVQVSLSHARP